MSKTGSRVGSRVASRAGSVASSVAAPVDDLRVFVVALEGETSWWLFLPLEEPAEGEKWTQRAGWWLEHHHAAQIHHEEVRGLASDTEDKFFRKMAQKDKVTFDSIVAYATLCGIETDPTSTRARKTPVSQAQRFPWFRLSTAEEKRIDDGYQELLSMEKKEEEKQQQLKSQDEKAEEEPSKGKKEEGKKASKKQAAPVNPLARLVFAPNDVPADCQHVIERWKVGRRVIICFSARSKDDPDTFIRCSPIGGDLTPAGTTVVDQEQLWAPLVKQSALTQLAAKSLRRIPVKNVVETELGTTGNTVYWIAAEDWGEAQDAICEEAAGRPTVRLSMTLDGGRASTLLAEGGRSVGRKSGRRSHTKTLKKMEELWAFLGYSDDDEQGEDVPTDEEEETTDESSSEEDSSDDDTPQRRRRQNKKRRLEASSDDDSIPDSVASSVRGRGRNAGGKNLGGRPKRVVPLKDQQSLVSVQHRTWAPASDSVEGKLGTDTNPNNATFPSHDHNVGKKPHKTFALTRKVGGKTVTEYHTQPDVSEPAPPAAAKAKKITVTTGVAAKKKASGGAGGGGKQDRALPGIHHQEATEADFLQDLVTSVREAKKE